MNKDPKDFKQSQAENVENLTEAERQLRSEKAGNNVKIMTPGKLVAKRFFRSHLSIIGLAMLVALFFFAFIGPLFRGILPFVWGETESVGATRVVSTTYKHTLRTDEYLSKNGNWIIYEGTVPYDDADMSSGSPQTRKQEYTSYEVRQATVNTKTKPTWTNWLGTDTYGYDVLSRLMYGGRISLLLSFIVVIAETFLGVVIGGISGYCGKWIDQIIMRVVDIFNCLPGLPILLICSSLLDGWGVESKYKIFWLMGILTVFGWSGIARLVRGQILSLREQEFMIAAEASGLSAKAKIFKHLIPNVMPQLIVQATLGLGGIILYEATLSYLGLGVPFPYAAWGSMIAKANPTAGGGRDILLNFPNLWVPAGICIVLAVLGFNFVGDGLRDAFDPKMKR